MLNQLPSIRLAESRLTRLWRRFSKRMKQERRQRKIPAARFARSLGVTLTALRSMEAGAVRWSNPELAVRLLTRREDWPD